MNVQLIIKNINVFNSYFKKFIYADVVINDNKFIHIGDNYEDRFYSDNIIDGKNKYMIPGLVDIHMHIESSMTIPSEFSKAVIKHGVTTVVADPHEIANVFGIDGINAFIKEKEKVDIFYGIPSSVPSTSNILETTGKEIELEDIKELLNNDKVLCLGEVMNFKELIEDKDSKINNIISYVKENKYNMPLEGHCPKISGVDLSLYVASGVNGDHTQQSMFSLEEKIKNGMFIEMQHKSITKENIDYLMNNNLYEHFCLATDDVMADKLLDGHLNKLVKEVINLGMTPENAIYIATYTPSRRMGLLDRGSISPGKKADFIILDSVKEFDILEVFKEGDKVYTKEMGLNKIYFTNKTSIDKRFYDSIHLDNIKNEDLIVKVPNVYKNKVTCRTMNVSYNTTFTKECEKILSVKDNKLLWENDDCALIAVFERYGKNRNVAFGIVEGEIIKEGAIATTWAHDHHNLMVMGRNIDDMIVAANEVISIGGGYAVADKGSVLASLSLPIGGIISDKPIETIGRDLMKVREAIKKLGYNHMNEIMSFSTLSLPVSPELKISDKGLIDVKKNKIVSLFKN